jgi:hypothetical protein
VRSLGSLPAAVSRALTLALGQSYGAELVGEVVRYEDSYRRCYVRGPEGIIVALAEQLS